MLSPFFLKSLLSGENRSELSCIELILQTFMSKKPLKVLKIKFFKFILVITQKWINMSKKTQLIYVQENQIYKFKH